MGQLTSRPVVLLLATLALGQSGCRGQLDCRPGTVFLAVDYGADVVESDQIELSLAVAGSAQQVGRPHTPGEAQETFEIEFGSAYPQGQVLTIDMQATRAGQILGQGQVTRILAGTCTALGAALGGFASGDGYSSSDLVGGDLTGGASDGSPGTTPLSLLAGKLGGQGNADGVATEARFDNPERVAADGAGNLYIADTANHTVRKLVLSGAQAGQVTTVAGVPGVPGSVDGTGSAARLDQPRGLAYDGSGNLYVAEMANHVIRRIVVTGAQFGMVTTVAGTLGTSGSADGTGGAARFFLPEALASDGAGNLYVADTANHTIRQIVLASAQVTTVAGLAGGRGSADGVGSTARFNSPAGVVYDGAGNLYVADTQNNTLRKIVLATGQVTTPAGLVGAAGSADGMGTAVRFANPRGLARDGAGDLYIADGSNWVIRKLAVATAQVTTVAGLAGAFGNVDGMGTAARFASPIDLAGDGATNLYVVDKNNQTIRRVDVAAGAQYAVSTLAGLAASPGAVDAPTGGAARFTYPSALAYDGTASLYIADSDNETIRKLVVSGANAGQVSTVAGTAGQLGTTDGTGSAARFYAPQGLVYDGSANLYVADTFNHTIRQVVVTPGAQFGMVSTVAGQPGTSGSSDGTGSAARFDQPMGLADDGAGNLYVADNWNCTIRQVVVTPGAQFGVVSTVAGQSGVCDPKDGIGSAAAFGHLHGLTYDSAGNLYVADTMSHLVRRVVVTPGAQFGKVTTLAGTIGISGSTDGAGSVALFMFPEELVYGAGNLYVADSLNHTIRIIATASTQVTTLIGVPRRAKVALGSLPGGLNYPMGLAVLSGGSLAITSPVENAIVLYRP